MSILTTLIEKTRGDLAVRRAETPEALLQVQAQARVPARNLASALRRVPGGPPRVIAELKKASPSKGLIREAFVPRDLARSLVTGGASALSVLTEPHFFLGSGEYLREASAVAEIPVLRKDFIVDPYQVIESRAWGADAILLIAAGLDDSQYGRLFSQARALGLGVLTEVHNAEELDRVLALGVDVVGINSRDLRTFEVDLGVTEQLLGRLPADCVKVAESGIRTAADMRRLCEAGADAFLIGETLMREPDPGEALACLLRAAARVQEDTLR